MYISICLVRNACKPAAAPQGATAAAAAAAAVVVPARGAPPVVQHSCCCVCMYHTYAANMKEAIIIRTKGSFFLERQEKRLSGELH